MIVRELTVQDIELLDPEVVEARLKEGSLVRRGED
jgi:hypothetical protein